MGKEVTNMKERQREQVYATQETEAPRVFTVVEAFHTQNGDTHNASVVVAHKEVVYMVSGTAENLAQGYLRAFQEALGDDLPEVHAVSEAYHVLGTEETPEHVVLKSSEREVVVFPHPAQQVILGFGLDKNLHREPLGVLSKTPVGSAVGEGLHYMVRQPAPNGTRE